MGFDPHDPVQCDAYNGTQIYNNLSRCAHVAHLGELRIAAKYDPTAPADKVQMWAEVLASWSAALHIDIGFVGPSDADDCTYVNADDDAWVDWTYMHICATNWAGTAIIGGYPKIIWDGYPYRHGAGGRIWLPTTHPLIPDTYDYRLVACHELGHYFGLNHGNTGGCMSPDTTTTTYQCPGPLALAMLSQLYEHDDVIQQQVQAPEPFAITAVNRCGG